MHRLTMLTLPAASLLLLALAGAPARAETTAGGSAAPATASVPQNKLVASYGEFAGSPENALSLVQGLRTGTAITLISPALPGSPPPQPVVFVPPTRPMGYGNIRIALALAQNQLSAQGITNPTPQQLQGALMGTDGVLQMRAAGMGWGQIANSQGVKLGSVMSGNSAAAAAHSAAGAAGGHAVSARGDGAVSTGHGSAARSGSGVTTGNGSAGRSGGGVTTADGSGGRGASRVTTAAGGGGGGAGAGNAYAYGRSGGGGAVTAAGASAGVHGGAAAGRGHGKP